MPLVMRDSQAFELAGRTNAHRNGASRRRAGRPDIGIIVSDSVADAHINRYLRLQMTNICEADSQLK